MNYRSKTGFWFALALVAFSLSANAVEKDKLFADGSGFICTKKGLSPSQNTTELLVTKKNLSYQIKLRVLRKEKMDGDEKDPDSELTERVLYSGKDCHYGSDDNRLINCAGNGQASRLTNIHTEIESIENLVREGDQEVSDTPPSGPAKRISKKVLVIYARPENFDLCHESSFVYENDWRTNYCKLAGVLSTTEHLMLSDRFALEDCAAIQSGEKP